MYLNNLMSPKHVEEFEQETQDKNLDNVISLRDAEDERIDNEKN